MVGLVIIIIILVVGGLYMWKMNKDTLAPTDTVTEEDSAELNTLEADLASTDTEAGVDVEGLE